jgi:hypothetical protein
MVLVLDQVVWGHQQVLNVYVFVGMFGRLSDDIIANGFLSLYAVLN